VREFTTLPILNGDIKDLIVVSIYWMVVSADTAGWLEDSAAGCCSLMLLLLVNCSLLLLAGGVCCLYWLLKYTAAEIHEKILCNWSLHLILLAEWWCLLLLLAGWTNRQLSTFLQILTIIILHLAAVAPSFLTVLSFSYKCYIYGQQHTTVCNLFCLFSVLLM